MSSQHIDYGGDQWHCTEWERAFTKDEMENIGTAGECPFCGSEVETDE